MRPVVGPDQLPVEVVVLTLAVVAEAGLGVFVKSAASCGGEKRRERTVTKRGKTFGTNHEATCVNVLFVIPAVDELLKNKALETAGSVAFITTAEAAKLRNELDVFCVSSGR